MTICAFIHGNDYVPLTKRILGMRKRIELEWAISCDLCQGMRKEYMDSETEKTPQCIIACPADAIFLGTIESVGNVSRIESIKEAFN